jgi:hypothetical protein
MTGCLYVRVLDRKTFILPVSRLISAVKLHKRLLVRGRPFAFFRAAPGLEVATWISRLPGKICLLK